MQTILSSRRGVGDKPMSCKPGSQVRFLASPCLSDETISVTPSSEML